MRATLLYNDRAGTAESVDRLVGELGDIGWRVVRRLGLEDIGDVASRGSDAIVVAGGDGTVGNVARRLRGTRIPMAIVPMGTANNVARSLGIGVDAVAAIAGLRNARERVIDLGVLSNDREKDHFLEGFGVGIFAYLLGEKSQTARKNKQIARALDLIADELGAYEARRYELYVEGRPASGAYILVAAMNMRSFGPALHMAPDAHCGDGALDVVLVRPESRDALVRHLRRAAEEGEVTLPAFEVVRASCLEVRGDGQWAHADSRARALAGRSRVDVAPGALRVLVP
jgi:diacylglycerol kinase family enzyme